MVMAPVNPLPPAGAGHPSGAGAHTDRRVDFAAWQHDSLVMYATDAYARINELEVDRKLLLEAYRELLRRAQ